MNASLDATNPSVADFPIVAADPASSNHGNLTLLLCNASPGVIVIDPSFTSVSIASPAVRNLFAENITSIPQACACPMSGVRDDPRFESFYMIADMFTARQCGFLKQLLHYYLILFAVLAAANS